MAFWTRLGVAAAALMAALALSACGGENAPAEREGISADPSSEAASVNGQTIYVSDVEMEARMKGLIRDNERLEPESAEFNEILEAEIIKPSEEAITEAEKIMAEVATRETEDAETLSSTITSRLTHNTTSVIHRSRWTTSGF